jgi:TfoX/Sxy family transcriptional regulator of competence genes
VRCAGAARKAEKEKTVARPEYSDAHKKVLDSLLAGMPGVEPGRMFGYPNIKVKGRMFACVCGPGVALKLPESRVAELLAERGNQPFTPRGRKMKEWVMVARKDSRAYLRLRDLFLESIEFTSRSAKKKRGR